jgi:FixJ family two-component response regulator
MQAGAVAFLDKPFSDEQLLKHSVGLKTAKALLTMLKRGPPI